MSLVGSHRAQLRLFPGRVGWIWDLALAAVVRL